MNLKQYRTISGQVNAELKAVFKKYGFDLRKLSARVDETTGVIRWSIEGFDTKHKAANGESTSPERELWKKFATLYDLNPAWLGKAFRFGGKSYTITGLRQRGKRNVLATRDGKTYVFAPDDVSVFMQAVGQAIGRPPTDAADELAGIKSLADRI